MSKPTENTRSKLCYRTPSMYYKVKLSAQIASELQSYQGLISTKPRQNALCTKHKYKHNAQRLRSTHSRRRCSARPPRPQRRSSCEKEAFWLAKTCTASCGTDCVVVWSGAGGVGGLRCDALSVQKDGSAKGERHIFAFTRYFFLSAVHTVLQQQHVLVRTLLGQEAERAQHAIPVNGYAKKPTF